MLIISTSPLVSSSGANRLDACAIFAVAPSVGDRGRIPSVAPLMMIALPAKTTKYLSLPSDKEENPDLLGSQKAFHLEIRNNIICVQAWFFFTDFLQLWLINKLSTNKLHNNKFLIKVCALFSSLLDQTVNCAKTQDRLLSSRSFHTVSNFVWLEFLTFTMQR